MKKIVSTVLLMLVSSVSIAAEKSEVIQIDVKLLCQIQQMEKRLTKDKSSNAADLSERIAGIKLAAVRAQETKDALSAVAMADKKEAGKLWKQFAKDHRVNAACF